MKTARLSLLVVAAIAGIAAACSEATKPIAPPVSFSSVHLKFGANNEPSFFDAGLALQSTGALSGLGMEDLVVRLTAQANVTASGSEAIPASAIKNGNVAFDVTTTEPERVIAGAPGCPNPNWTEEITDLSFTSATITVEQPVGTVVLTVSCTLSSPTTDGAVSGSIVSCTSQQP